MYGNFSNKLTFSKLTYLLFFNLPLEIFLVFRGIHVAHEMKELVTSDSWRKDNRIISHKVLHKFECRS